MHTAGKKNLVLSTVGITPLGNSMDSGQRRILYRNSNLTESGLSGAFRTLIDDTYDKALAFLRRSDIAARRKYSPELNGIYGYFNNDLRVSRDRDQHFLIATDTYAGKRSAELLQEFLEEEEKLNVQIYTPKSLNTARQEDFEAGMKALIKWCEDCVPGYHDAGNHIVFNLTGAFKSMQGYLNLIGMFYADELVYIFETGKEILSIPALPIRIDREKLEAHAVTISLMRAGHLFAEPEVSGIPRSMIETIHEANVEYASLSGWGLLIWNRIRYDILKTGLLKFPGIAYSGKFTDVFRKAAGPVRVEVQEALAKVSAKLLENNGNTDVLTHDKGLNFEALNRPGEKIYSFRINRSLRVACVVEKNKLLLKSFGTHDEIYRDKQ